MGTEKREILRATQAALKKVHVQTSRGRIKKDDFPEWLVKYLHYKRGNHIGKFSFKGYEPYLPIARQLNQFEEVRVLKGAQVACTTILGIGWVLFNTWWRGLDCAYGLPDKTMVRQFMKTRVNDQQIRKNRDLAAVYDFHDTDMYLSANQTHYIYFLGVHNVTEQLSKPIERMVLDEITIIPETAIETIQERMKAAAFPQMVGFARELYPGGPAQTGYESCLTENNPHLTRRPPGRG